MIHKCPKTLGSIVFFALAASMSCVEREETITIAPDGAVTVELEYEGSEKEVTQGDAMPSAESGWDVVRTREEDDDGVTLKLESVRRFEPGEELPRSFAADGDPDADLYLDFPTTVRVEDRADGRYFYFHRVYTARRWAYVQNWEEVFVDDEVKKLGEKPVEELTPEERVQIVEAFAGVEAFKQIEFARIALEESHADLPVEYGLMARRVLIGVYHNELANQGIERMIKRCEDLPEDERGECFNQEAERVLGIGYAAYVQSLREDGGLNQRQIAAFDVAYERAERYHELTGQLAGHSFEIRVAMPGTIIAHSGLNDETEVDEDNNTSTVRFAFDGKLFRDRPHELIVVSRLDHDAVEKEESHAADHDR